jgi:hypothetical protein
MVLVVSGLLNKQIAAELGISEITVKAHRGRVMRKMHVDSLADLVRVAAALEVPARQKRSQEPYSPQPETAGLATNSPISAITSVH